MIDREDYEKQIILGMKPEIIADIATNLDVNLFRRDAKGYSYYGFYIDKAAKSIVVVTQNRNGDTVRITFNGYITVECAGRELAYPVGNSVGLTLNRFLREYFDVPHAVDSFDEVDVYDEMDTHTQWNYVINDTL